MEKKQGVKAARERTRRYELREAEFWRGLGWTVDVAWNECRGFIRTARGSVPIIKRRDFFGHFDILALKRVTIAVGIQVTETPFVDVRPSRKGYQNAGAGHGSAPFDWDGMGDVGDPDHLAATGGNEGAAFGGGFYQVIVSYADARKPERRWWLSA